jgi:hypothetical protein
MSALDAVPSGDLADRLWRACGRCGAVSESAAVSRSALFRCSWRFRLSPVRAPSSTETPYGAEERLSIITILIIIILVLLVIYVARRAL